MKVKRFVLCLFMLTLIGGICFISCGNTSKAKAESDVAAETAEGDLPVVSEENSPQVLLSSIPVSSFR